MALNFQSLGKLKEFFFFHFFTTFASFPYSCCIDMLYLFFSPGTYKVFCIQFQRFPQLAWQIGEGRRGDKEVQMREGWTSIFLLMHFLI